jgi:hypothetical protein
MVAIGLITHGVLLGCGSDGANDSTPLTVTDTTPASGAVDVGISSPISATFSGVIDSSTLRSETFQVSANDHTIDGVLSVTASTDASSAPVTIATFTPVGTLVPWTVYTGKITNAVRGLGGSNMLADHVWSFTTQVAPITMTVEDITNSFRDIGTLPSFQSVGGSLVIIEAIGTPTPCYDVVGDVQVEEFLHEIVVGLEAVPVLGLCAQVPTYVVGRATIVGLPTGEYSVRLTSPRNTVNTTITIAP